MLQDASTFFLRFVALLLAAVGTATGQGAERRPNLVFVYTDDQRFDGLAANGNPRIRTPNLDRLAQRGLRFTNANVVLSLCSPSRAAALTGRYGSGNGVLGLDGVLREGEQTFGQLLRDAGYRTAFVGKWHLKTKVPTAGFDYRCYFTSNGPYHKRKVWDQDRFVRPDEHVDAYCVDRSIDFVRESARGDRPFVLFHATQLPHMGPRHSWPSDAAIRGSYRAGDLPLRASWRGDLRGKPAQLAKVRNRTQAERYGYTEPGPIREHTADYYAVITELDAMLGKLIDAIRDAGIDDETYIVFMSDNGWLLGEHRMTSKVLAYDRSVRVPLVVAGPGVKPGVESRIALNIDIAPTLLDLAGVEVPSAMHGRSLAPLWSEADTAWRDAFVYEGLGTYGDAQPTLAACDGRWRLICTWPNVGSITRSKPSFVELYDVEADPEERENVADRAAHAKVRAELMRHVEAHIATHLRLPPPDPKMRLVTPGSGAREFGGIYPHLASFNDQGECGTGAVVPWADRLWWLTYSPHQPRGSSDRLYAANAELDFFEWPGSVGGTPANRMIHEETRQLLIGAYQVGAVGDVQVIRPDQMLGRLTGNARHLTEPERKVYYATMEEGVYEVDLKTRVATTLFRDTHEKSDVAPLASLPGYHGKGLYSGQGVLIYANNGEYGKQAQRRPDVPSGVLAEWDGDGDWRVVRRNQFTEVTGPGGIHGNPNPATDPIWSNGWDHRSLLLMLRSKGEWHAYRLPKPSHCYDGAHGWNTEWPRIRDIGESDLLMTMHGSFWRFPRNFDLGAARGIEARSTYLAVIGDFCKFGERIVLGCDDAAKVEFLNTRRAKGNVAGPIESQSNLWFVAPEQLDQFGPAIGRGGVWVGDQVEAGKPSDPFAFDGGFDHRSMHLAHDAGEAVTFRLEVDRDGDGRWQQLREVVVPATGYAWTKFDPASERGAWVRVAASRACRATAWFEFRDRDSRTDEVSDVFDSLAVAGDAKSSGGIVLAGARDVGLRLLSDEGRYYELGANLEMRRVNAPERAKFLRDRVAPPTGLIELDGDSLLYVDDSGRRYRLPIGNEVYRNSPELLDRQRTAREAVTERDLFQCGGTFYELPSRNAGGFARIRPISTHPHFVRDWCSWRGLLVLTGIRDEADASDPRIVRSDDGECAVWLGAIDDLWSLGKPRGEGGPWQNTTVRAGEPSDPYLFAGFDRKSIALSHDADRSVTMRVELDITGTGAWHVFREFEVASGAVERFDFPAELAAYWIRVVADRDCAASAHLSYR